MLGIASTVKHSPSCLMKIFIFHILTIYMQSKNDLKLVLLSFALPKLKKLTCLKPSGDTTEKLMETSTESKVVFSATQKLSEP